MANFSRKAGADVPRRLAAAGGAAGSTEAGGQTPPA